MKKNLLAIAVGAALAAPVMMPVVAHADGPVDGKVYGKIRVSANYVDKKDDTTDAPAENVLESHASRIGFKGATDLTDFNNLSVIYQAEYGIDGQINNGDNWSPRNTFVGLKGNLGTILAGRHDTPFKGAQGGVDQFNDLDGDLSGIFDGEDRLNQTVMYMTPSMGPVSAAVAYVMSNSNDSNVKNTTNRDGVSAALMYSQSMFYGSVAYNNNINNMDSLRVTGIIKPTSALQLGAMFQQSKCNDENAPSLGQCNGGLYGAQADDSESGYLVSAAYSLGRTTLKAQYGDSDIYKISTKAAYQQDMSVGASYKLGSQTNLEGWVTRFKNDDNNGAEVTYVAMGLQHKF